MFKMKKRLAKLFPGEMQNTCVFIPVRDLRTDQKWITEKNKLGGLIRGIWVRGRYMAIM